MSDYGIKVSKEGFDIETASDDNLAFSSGFNHLKLHASGSVDISLADGETVSDPVAVQHDLGYKPATEVFLNSTSDVASWAVSVFYQTPLTWDKIDHIVVTLELFNNKIEMKLDRGPSSSTSGAITRTAYYRIYLDEALS